MLGMHYPGTERKSCDCHHAFGDSGFPAKSRPLLRLSLLTNETVVLEFHSEKPPAKYDLSVETKNRDYGVLIWHPFLTLIDFVILRFYED
jgi:hypothetical protein